jgi:hypothetical protein
MPAVREGQPRDAPRKCGSQSAHQSLITDVLQVPFPLMRELSFGRSLESSEPKTLPEPLTADIRAMLSGHPVGWGVGPGHELVDLAGGVAVDETGQDIGEIGLGIDRIELTGLDQ